MARAWFFLVLLNSSSFSATRLSISCLTLASSSWERRTLFSSISRVASASSRAPWSSSFSCSSIRRCLSRAWMERPPSPSWSRRSLISSARFLFSRLTTSSCSMDSCWAAFRRNSSEEKLRPSSWEALISAERSAALDCHSPRTLSKFLARFSVMRAAAWTLSYSMERSSRSVESLPLDFSALATLVERTSTSSSFSTILAWSLLRAPSSSSMRPIPSVSKRDFHSWISAWDLDRALRASDFLMASFSSFSLKFSRSVDIILYLVRRDARSLASASARALVSSSWVVTEILALFMLAIAFSSSSICLLRSWFSTWSLFLVDSASLRARAISSSLVLESTMEAWRSLPCLSSSALPLTASSRSRRASRRSSSMPALSFSDLTLLALRLSICSPRSAMVLLCFMRRAARVPSWAMFSSSSSALSLASSPSRFLLSSTWVAALEPASSRREEMSSMSFLSMVRLFSALARLPLSTLSSSSSSSKKFSLDTLKIRDGLLGQFQVSLKLPLGLLNISLDLLFTLKSILSFIKSLLELSLYSGQMVALVLSSLNVLLGLLSAVSNRSLLLAQLANHVGLVSNFILQSSDLVILVSSVLFSRGKDSLKVGNISLELGNSGVDLLDLSFKSNLLLLLSLDTGIDSIKLLLDISSLSFNSGGFVNNLLNSRSTRLQSKRQLSLLSHKAVIDSLDLASGLKSLTNVGLSKFNLVLIFFLELAKLCNLRLGLMASQIC